MGFNENATKMLDIMPDEISVEPAVSTLVEKTVSTENAEIEDDSSSSSSSNSPVVFDEEVSDEINKTDEEEIIIKQDSIGNNSSEKTNELLEDLDNEKSLDSIENQEFEEQNKNKIIGVLIKIIPVFLILILIILIYKLKKGVK